MPSRDARKDERAAAYASASALAVARAGGGGAIGDDVANGANLDARVIDHADYVDARADEVLHGEELEP